MANEEMNFDFEITKDDFAFVQQDKKIHDKKFETKPTTFAKDAFKRFCKNKSSVVGAIILGILILMAIFVPVFSSSNISTISLEERFLAPKLFSSGTGFWDGTTSKKDIIYDAVNKEPAGYGKSGVSNLVVNETPSYINNATEFGVGGSLAFINENLYFDYDGNEDVNEFVRDLYFYNKTTFTSTDNATVNIRLLNDVFTETELADYQIVINYNNGEENAQFVLVDWTKEIKEYNLNISQLMADAELQKFENAQFCIRLKPGNLKRSSIVIKSIEFKTNGANKAFLEKMGFTSGNEMALRYLADEETKAFVENYWQSTGQKSGYQVEVYYCTFTYDTYEAAYGFQDVVVAKTTLDQYIKDGLCEYDPEVGPESFKKLSEDCPIDEVVSQKLNSKTGRLLEVTTHQYKYKQLGYKSMPKFLFGTDASGYDIFKYAFSGLRTSLILGICTAAFCFIFGLIWGAISGYFGGNVDLAMERFCDILNGIPWIVMMTLFILHLGSNFFTFFLALCLTGWMGTAGRTRTQFYRFKGREYVLASRTLGASDMRLIFKHILPNAMGTIITGAVLMIPSVIFSESTLAYLNLGLKNVDSFGVILANNQQYIGVYPNLIVFPAVVMSLMMISFNLFGNGLRDAFNPSLKGGEM